MPPRCARLFLAGVALALPLTLAAQREPAPAPEVSAACHEAFVVVSGTAGVKTRRSIGTFNDETLRAPVRGCGITITGSFKKAAATGAACFARGEWDGGADGEPEIPASDPYKVIVFCGTAAMFVRTP